MTGKKYEHFKSFKIKTTYVFRGNYGCLRVPVVIDYEGFHNVNCSGCVKFYFSPLKITCNKKPIINGDLSDLEKFTNRVEREVFIGAIEKGNAKLIFSRDIRRITEGIFYNVKESLAIK